MKPKSTSDPIPGNAAAAGLHDRLKQILASTDKPWIKETVVFLINAAHEALTKEQPPSAVKGDD